MIVKKLVSLTALCAGFVFAGTVTDVYQRSIQELGGRVVNPGSYPATVEGFQKFLTDTGVKAVSAAELTTPNHPEVAKRLGYTNFLPPQSWWSRGAALAMLTQSIEAKAGAPVLVRNWWRPAAYNTDPAVKGAKNGDHPTANAVDLDYHSARERAAAELFLRDLKKRCPWMQLSFGLGAQTTHVGIGSAKGSREWHYAGWKPATAV